MKKNKDIKIASILGLLGNIGLLVIKLVAGIITNSQSMISDAFNSAGDIFSSLLTFIGNKISSKPSDDDHNLGHGKAEYIYSLIISIVMIFTCLIIIKNSIFNLFRNEEMTYSNILVVVCIITIIIKLLLYLYTNVLSKKYNNILIKANSKDHLCDCFVSLSNLIGIIISKFAFSYMDNIMGILISLWIIIQYLYIFTESYDVLMDKSISNDLKNKVIDIIKSHKEILGYQHFNSTPIGFLFQISITIEVDGNLSTFMSHKIADNLEKEIVNKVDEIYLVVIHVNPVKSLKNSKKN